MSENNSVVCSKMTETDSKTVDDLRNHKITSPEMISRGSNKRAAEDDGDAVDAVDANSTHRSKLRRNEQSEDTSSGIPSKVVDDDDDDDMKNKSTENALLVASHYNSIEEKGLSFRSQSKIIYLRNFNNWTKSMLISEYVSKTRQNKSHGTPLRVLDMCCGKGGDLFKWKKSNISHIICADIADVSIDQCKIRYNDLANFRNRGEYGSQSLFTAEFIVADCTKVRLREKYKDPSMQVDLVSCQFALHYGFESLPQAECMLKNASETLKTDGYFIATIPNAYDLVSKWKKVDGNSFGNLVYNVEFAGDKNDIPLFGAKYHFKLEGVVNCPEFLIYLPLLKKLALKCGLDFVSFERFDEFYERVKIEGKSLQSRSQVFETYPPNDNTQLNGQAPEDYQHAEDYLKSMATSKKIGTISLSEWEAITLYGVVTFRKMKTRWNSEGKPEYFK